MTSLHASLAVVALFGVILGGLLYRAIERLALQKSLVWPPRAHCTRCLQPLPWRWMIPLFGPAIDFWRCPTCRRRQGLRKPLLELLTAGLLAGLYWMYLGDQRGWAFPFYPLPFHREMRQALFVYHAILVSLLVVATFIDLDWMIIPDSVTIPGMLLGVGLGTFWYVELHPVPLFSPPMTSADLTLLEPGWTPNWLSAIPSDWEQWVRRTVNQHWMMNWNRWLGFLTSIVGLAAGWSIVWVVRWICTWAFGKEAMGFGDVTLMAMIGSFIGWQSVILAFFLAPLSAVVVGLIGWLLAGRGELPYGPHLSIATVAILFVWRRVWFVMEPLFADMAGFAVAAVVMLAMLAVTAGAVQRMKQFYLRVRAAQSASRV